MDQINQSEKERMEVSKELLNSRREIVEHQKIAESLKLSNFELKRQVHEMGAQISSHDVFSQTVIPLSQSLV